MIPNQDPANPIQDRVLEPIEFDLSEHHPLTSAPGKTATPVRVLPETSFDLAQQLDLPLLQLTLHLRPDADPACLTVDVLRLFHALSRYERELGGQGVTWDEARSQATPGVLRLVVSPNDPNGAKERLATLAAVVTTAQSPSPTVPRALGEGSKSFAKLEAVLLNEAA